MENERKRISVKRIVFAVLNTGLFIGAFVSLLVNYLVNGRFTWSFIVAGAIGMSWLILAPWFVFSNNRFVFSWTAAAISVPLFLYLVESLSPGRGWLVPLGLPSALMGLTAIGAIGWLWLYTRIKPLYVASLSFLLAALLSFGEVTLTHPFLEPDPYAPVRYLVSFCILGASLLLGIVALSVHGFKPFRAS